MKQKWRSLGRIYNPIDYSMKFNFSSVPIIKRINGDNVNVIFTCRNSENKSMLSEVIFNLNTLKVIDIPKFNLLMLGSLGSFDEDGVMASDIFEIQGKPYLTYIGWNRGVSVPFRNSIGLAEIDKGEKYNKVFEGPILDRNIYDLCFVASNCVIKTTEGYWMYYLSCFKWESIGEAKRHFYNIKIAKSQDGLNWTPTGLTAIDFIYDNEYAISVPRVIFENKKFKMWFSYRGGNLSDKYLIGYAESDDGLKWSRMDEKIIFINSNEDWDSDMICYPYIFDFKGERYMLYNGNDYGKTGFGLAILER